VFPASLARSGVRTVATTHQTQGEIMSDVLVLGATGTVGRRLVERLRAEGTPLRAANRNPPPPTAGSAAVRFDWDDPTTWPPALEGVGAVFIVAPAYRADPADQIGALVELADRHGAQRLVLLSALGVDDAPPDSGYHRMEQEVRSAPMPTVVLQPGWFAQDLTEKFMAPRDGVVTLPAAGAAIAWIDAADIADVAAAALTDAVPSGTLQLTGPEAVDMQRTAELLSRAHGEPITYRDADPGQFADGMIAAGLPEAYVDMLSGLFAGVRAGAASLTTSTVSDVLGRPATDLAHVLERELGSRDHLAPSLGGS
jgi:uncharacterized protein YbjT (DUF2867 family)